MAPYYPAREKNPCSFKWCPSSSYFGSVYLPGLVSLHHMDPTATPNYYHPECAQAPFLPHFYMLPGLMSRTPWESLLRRDPSSGLPLWQGTCHALCSQLPSLLDSEHLHHRAWRLSMSLGNIPEASTWKYWVELPSSLLLDQKLLGSSASHYPSLCVRKAQRKAQRHPAIICCEKNERMRAHRHCQGGRRPTGPVQSRSDLDSA